MLVAMTVAVPVVAMTVAVPVPVTPSGGVPVSTVRMPAGAVGVEAWACASPAKLPPATKNSAPTSNNTQAAPVNTIQNLLLMSLTSKGRWGYGRPL